MGWKARHFFCFVQLLVEWADLSHHLMRRRVEHHVRKRSSQSRLQPLRTHDDSYVA
jgi:hypothetical protein